MYLCTQKGKKENKFTMESFLFLGFGFHAWVTIITVLGMFTILLFTKLRSDLVFLGAMAILYVTGGSARRLCEGCCQTDVTSGGAQFVSEQHHGCRYVRKYRQDVVEQVAHVTL